MTPDTSDRFRTAASSASPGRSSPSNRDHVSGHWRSALLIVASVACGSLGWSGNVLAFPVAMVFPALWAMSPSRVAAVLVSAGYFLAASRGLPQGVANFYSADLCPGFLLWIAASASFVAVHAVAWTRRPEGARPGKSHLGTGRPVRYLAVAALMALPPFGITGWAHPLTAAGVVFPGWGWWGLAAAAAGLLVMVTRHWPAAAIGLGGFWLWSAATWTELNLPEGWRGVDLELGQRLGRDTSLEHHRGLIATAHTSASQGARVVVFPESALGFWTPTVARLWREGLNGLDVTVVAGAAVIDVQGYDNVMAAVGSGAGDILYKERMPVPFSMWQPWRVSVSTLQECATRSGVSKIQNMSKIVNKV